MVPLLCYFLWIGSMKDLWRKSKTTYKWNQNPDKLTPASSLITVLLSLFSLLWCWPSLCWLRKNSQHASMLSLPMAAATSCWSSMTYETGCDDAVDVLVRDNIFCWFNWYLDGSHNHRGGGRASTRKKEPTTTDRE